MCEFRRVWKRNQSQICGGENQKLCDERKRDHVCVQGNMLGQLCLFHIAQTRKTITLDEIFGCTDIEIWELSPVHWCP